MAEAVALAGASWAMSITRWVASPIISKLLNEGFSYLGIDMAARIDKLEATILPQFQEVIDAAERSEHKSNLEKWLRRLKEAMFEAEDALDLYKYRLIQQEVENGGTTMKKISNKISSSFSILSTEKIKLRTCLNKLEKIALEAKEFRDLLGRQVKNNPKNSIKEPMVTTSKPPPRICGRDADCDSLVKELLEPVASEPESSTVRSYSVHSIVGVGGAGKTTLAQLVYNDERVTAQFDLRIWLSMTRGLDLNRHTRIMVEAASKNECPHLDSLDILQDVLINSIKSKKILVMMDDVWWDETINELKWEQFVAPLGSVKRGSRILLTSRTTKMPRVLLPQKIMSLKELEENHFFTLFMHYAFVGLELNSTHSQVLEIIGRRIAMKLSRSPLAAKAVGSRLFKKPNERFWNDTLERDMLTDTMQSLLWSYQNLDAPVQRCFSYCAIFPKGFFFSKEDLILFWVAEGFIHSSTRRMEDVGEDYFQELLSVFFFQIVHDRRGNERYGMHDLFHELSERVSREDCFRIEDGQFREIPLFARHLSIQGESFNKYIMSVEKLKNLRTIIFIYPVSDNVIKSFLKKIEKFTKLRLVELCRCSINKLPNSVGELVHLRYLGLHETGVAELPTSVQKLYNLQTLRLNDMYTDHLPRGLNKLVNLRHLMCWTEVTSTLPEIGKLTSLQELHRFRVKNEKGYEISQLKRLNEIRGSLDICDLKNIKNREEATEANLKDKKYVERLSFIWGDDDAMHGNLNAHLEVLEGLIPHPNLKGLSIVGYKSPTYPSWMFQQGSLNNLRSLALRNCPSSEVLPVFPLSLKELHIKECWSLVFIYEEELQKVDYEARLLMVIKDCQLKFILETIPDMKNRARQKLLKECLELRWLMKWDMSVLLTNLERTEIPGEEIWEAHLILVELRMKYIYSKKEKYHLNVPSSLERLSITSCYITDGALMHCLAQLTCLKSLELDDIRTITVLPPMEVLCQLVVLNCLTISSCDFLISLGGLHALVSIESLYIKDCPCLEIPGEGGRSTLPPSLKSLTIRDCDSIKYFEVRDLPSLSLANFKDCHQLKSMVLTNLSSLKTLNIRNCPELFELICSDMLVLVSLYILECPNLQQIFKLAWASLKVIQIGSFSMLGKFPSNGELVNLEFLSIEKSKEAFFNEDEFGCLTSLRILFLHHCKVQALPCSMKNLSSITRINLSNCYELLSLPDMSETVQFLSLAHCPAIASLPVLPKSLCNLYIYICPNLSKRCQKPDGEDWPKISHIPSITII